MKMLGIDYGTKRVGVAVSDEEGRLAFPHSVVENSGDADRLAKKIGEIASRAPATEIVIGESRDYAGNANPILPKILELKKRLEESSFTVHLEPEFMTSAQAEHLQGKHDTIDASAAAIILQSFLDKKKN